MARGTHALSAFAVVALLAVMAPAAHAEMSEADRLARCANNNARIAELQAELARDPRYMSPEEIARAKAAILSAAALDRQAGADPTRPALEAFVAQMANLSRNFRVDMAQCVAPAKVSAEEWRAELYQVVFNCSVNFDSVMGKRIETAESLAPLRATIEARIEQHRTNLAALQCVAVNTGNAEETSQPSGVQTSSKGCHGFDGRWDSGGFTVTMHGSTGSYTYNNVGSSLSGTVNGNTMTGHYQQPGYPNANFTNGEFTFMLSAGGDAWTGSYTDKDGNPSGSWNGTCVGP